MAIQGVAALNTAQMGSQPLTLALSLAAAAVLALALTVLTSVRQRRRQLAVLKTLGLRRRQLRAIVAWQASWPPGTCWRRCRRRWPPGRLPPRRCAPSSRWEAGAASSASVVWPWPGC